MYITIFNINNILISDNRIFFWPVKDKRCNRNIYYAIYKVYLFIYLFIFENGIKSLK